MAGWHKLTRLLINPERDDVVSILIGGQQEGSRWINGEITRVSALRWLMVNASEFARTLVDLEDDDAVMAAIGAIDKLS